MGDFFAPSGGFQPPIEPDTPPPDFGKAGLNWALGVSKGVPLYGWAKNILDLILQAVATIVGWLAGLVGQLLAYFIRNMASADEAAQSGYADLIASELQALFGLSYNSAALQGVANAKNRADLGNQVGAAILQSIFAPGGAASGAGVDPTDQPAKKFLGAVMTMEVEGWFHSWLFDALSYHELEKFGDLKDGIARTLGLGRMSRQVFAPPLKIFCHDPYLALLNQAYRPEHLPAASAIRQHFRGELSRQQLSTILGRQGWQEQYIDYLINEHQKYLSDSDVDYLIARGTWTNDDGLRYLQEQGWDNATATRRLSILHDQRIDKYRREITAAGVTAYIAGEISSDQLRTIVQASGLSQDEQDWTIRVAGTRRELHATHLSRGDIERLIRDGVLNFGDLQNWATRNQMPIDEERFLELGLAVDEAKTAAAAKAKADAAKAKAAAAQLKVQQSVAKAAQAKAQAPDKGISVSEAETLVLDGYWTFDHLSAYLAARNYSPDAITAIEHLLHVKMDAHSAASGSAGAVRSAAQAKGIPLATMEKAAIDGIISIADLQQFLAAQGFDVHDQGVIVHLTQHAIDVQKVKDQAKAAAEARAGKHGISLVDLEHSVRIGLAPVATYQAALRAAGYDDMSVTLLTGILQSQMDADKAAAAKKGAATAAAGVHGLTLAELEAEVVAGIRPIADYTAALAALHYSIADQESLTQLLQLKLDAQRVTTERHAAAGAAAGTVGLSLPAIERAVRLGVLKIADYTAALQGLKLDQHTIDVLTNTLKARVAATAAAQQTTNSAAKTAKAKGISLVEEERAVLAGIKPISAYSALLSSLGYNSADTATMTRLLQLKLDQAAHAKDKFSDAIGVATAKGIDLAKAEEAVLKGITTTEDYTAMLTTLGFDATDRAVLVQLLQAKLQAAAAKAGGGGPPPA